MVAVSVAALVAVLVAVLLVVLVAVLMIVLVAVLVTVLKSTVVSGFDGRLRRSPPVPRELTVRGLVQALRTG